MDTAMRFRKIEADVSKVNSLTTQQMDAFQPKLLELEIESSTGSVRKAKNSAASFQFPLPAVVRSCGPD